MAAQPQKYFTVTTQPGNATAGAHLPGEDPPSGLAATYDHVIQNTSRYDRVFFEEREPTAEAGSGQVLDPLEVTSYRVNPDSPLFAWTQGKEIEVILAIGPAI